MRRMSLKLLCFSLLLVCSITAHAFQSFYHYSPASSTINGIKYPRNQHYLYRGTTDQQINLESALKALLGDKNIYVESYFFSTIKNKLLKQTFPHEVTVNAFLNRKIQEALSGNSHQALTLSNALDITRKLVDGTFAYYAQTPGHLEAQYFNYRNSEYVDWPKDAVFSTVISPLAGTYGNRVLVIKEKTPRSLDLTYWNYINNNKWYDHTRDVGEFIAHGYIPPDDIVGYQMRSKSDVSWHWIDYAFYQHQEKGHNFVLVFSGNRNGRKSTCMTIANDQMLYHCEFRVGEIILDFPKVSNELVTLLGVIVPCSQPNKCETPDAMALRNYPIDSTSQSHLNAILPLAQIQINNKSFKFISAQSLKTGAKK